MHKEFDCNSLNSTRMLLNIHFPILIYAEMVPGLGFTLRYMQPFIEVTTFHGLQNAPLSNLMKTDIILFN